MADLGDYIDFSIQFDTTGDKPVVRLTDTGDYPVGVAATIKGNFIIIQPDTGQYGKMDFDNPNIKWDSEDSALTPYEYTPRGACDSNIQNGTWKIKYIIEADGYDNTMVTKSFYLDFAAPDIKIGPDFDVFTPNLRYKDNTTYTKSGFTADITRSWSVKIEHIDRTVTGNSQNVDLKYLSSYYDSAYHATLVSTVTYTHNTFDWLTVKVKLTANDIAYAFTPPSCSTLMNQLNAFGESIVCECGDPSKDAKYVTAATMLNTITHAMSDAMYDGLYDNIVKFETVVLGSYTPTNTGAKINAFTYNCGQVTVINNSSTTVVSGENISFNVGDDGYPQDGDTTFTDDRLYNRVVFFFSKGNILLSATDGSYSYDDDVDGTNGRITVTYPFSQGEAIIIGTLPKST